MAQFKEQFLAKTQKVEAAKKASESSQEFRKYQGRLC